MALSIRSFRVDWLAYVDPAVYRGFRVALTETGQDPQWGAVHWANVRPLLAGNGRYAYEFRNVSLDNSKGYTAWVQVLGDGLESRWEGVANIYAPDDGVGLLLTEAAAELLRATLAQLEGQIDGELAVWFGDGEPLVDGYPAEDWTTPSLLSEHTGDVYYDRLSGAAYRFDGAAWAPLSDASMLAAVARARAALEMSGSRAQVIVTDSPSNLPNPPYNVNDLWLNGTDIMVCVTAAGVGATASLSHWTKKSAYTNQWDEIQGDNRPDDNATDNSDWEDPDNPGQIDGGVVAPETITPTALVPGMVIGGTGGGLGSYTVPACASAFVFFCATEGSESGGGTFDIRFNDVSVYAYNWEDSPGREMYSYFGIVSGGGSLVFTGNNIIDVSCGFFAIK